MAAGGNADAVSWDSFENLLEHLSHIGFKWSKEQDGDIEVLERRHLSDENQKLAKKLTAHHRWLLGTLSCFKPPNSSSKLAIEKDTVTIGKESLKITPRVRKLALEASSHLLLDEVQAFVLVTRYLESSHGDIAPGDPDKAFLRKIVAFYLVERQCLLKCVCTLLSFKEALSDDVLSQWSAIEEEVKSLIAEGLEEKTIAVLKEHLKLAQPIHLGQEEEDTWAEETSLELRLLMDVLFLLYYGPVSLSGKSLTDLWSILEMSVFGSSSGEGVRRLAITAIAEENVSHLQNLAILIIIEALDFDRLLLMVFDNTQFTGGDHPLSLFELKELGAKVVTALDGNMESNSLEGLLLLAWVTFLQLLHSLPSPPPAVATMAPSMQEAQQAALVTVGLQHLLRMLRSGLFQEPEVQVDGYKSVLRSLVSAFVAAYEFARQADFEGSEAVVAILCELYQGHEGLCLAFWDRDSIVDGPIRSFLSSMWDHFPYQCTRLLRLLSAVCEGPWPAECVYDYLYRGVHVTTLYQLAEPANRDLRAVRTDKTLQVPHASGLYIPGGTCGLVLDLLDDDVALVRWQCAHSGIMVLLVRMMERAAAPDETGVALDETREILHLLDRLLSANPVLAQLLLTLNDSAAANNARSQGVMDAHSRLDVTRMICTTVDALAKKNSGVALLASSLRILSSFIACYPERLLSTLFGTSLFQSFIASRGIALADTAMHSLLLKGEQRNAEYPLTLAVLEVGRLSLKRGVRNEEAARLVLYTQAHVLSSFMTWRFVHRGQRWQIAAKALDLVRAAAVSPRWPFPHTDLTKLVDYGVVHTALLQVLSTDSSSLKAMRSNRAFSPKEIEAREVAVCSALDCISDLMWKNETRAWIDKAMLQRAPDGLPAVAIVSSYLDYFPCPAVQEASARALTALVVLSGQQSALQSVSLTVSLAVPGLVDYVRSALAQLLSDPSGLSSSSPQIFHLTINLLQSAATYQPALAELWLAADSDSSKPKSTSTPSSSTLPAPSTETALALSNGSGTTSELSSAIMDAVWSLLGNSPQLYDECPQVLAQVLGFLVALWEGGAAFFKLVESLRLRPSFWSTILSCLPWTKGAGSNSPLKENGKGKSPQVATPSGTEVPAAKQEMLHKARQMQCEASILRLVALDVFAQGPIEPSAAPGEASTSSALSSESSSGAALAAVKEWFTGPKRHFLAAVKSYAIPLAERPFLARAEAASRMLAVGLMVRALAGQEQGLDASLVGRFRHAARELLQQVPMQELLERYKQSHFGQPGHSLELLVLSDLYEHIQGEVEQGRPIPAGTFRQAVLHLSPTCIHRLLQPTTSPGDRSGLDAAPGLDEEILYRTASLADALGLEWWSDNATQVLPPMAADEALRALRRANGFASLAAAHSSALASWAALVAVSTISPRGRRVLGAEGAAEGQVESSLELTCQALQMFMQLPEPQRLQNVYFADCQVTLQLALIRWLVATPKLTGQQLGLCASVACTATACLQAAVGGGVQLDSVARKLLTVLLTALECLGREAPVERGARSIPTTVIGTADVFAEVALMGVNMLPTLCRLADHPPFSAPTLAVLDVLAKSYLAPPTWLPIVRAHFPLRQLLSRLPTLDPTNPNQQHAFLHLCLTLSSSPQGASLLVSANTIAAISRLMSATQAPPSPKEATPTKRVPGGEVRQHVVWCAALSVATCVLRTSASDREDRERAVPLVLDFVGAQSALMLHSLHAMMPPVASANLYVPHGVGNKPYGITLAGLHEARMVVLLLVETSHFRFERLHSHTDIQRVFMETCIRLIGSLAHDCMWEPPKSADESAGSTLPPIACAPTTPEERVRATKGPKLRVSKGWFALTAHASASRGGGTSTSALPGLGADNALTVHGAGTLSTVLGSVYSEDVAVGVYRLLLLLLRFVCQVAGEGMRQLAEAGPGPWSPTRIPLLPPMATMHVLQEQCMATAADLASRPELSEDAISVGSVLLSCIEHALFLEACYTRIHGASASAHLHTHSFARWHKALVAAVKPRNKWTSELEGVEGVIPLVHPGLA